MNAVTAILLAAGLSRRFGVGNKLLVEIEGETMVRRIATALCACKADRLVVVLGHEAEQIAGALSGLPLETVVNPHYGDGRVTSVRVGVGAVSEDAGGFMMCLADQPYLAATDYDDLMDAVDAVIAEGYIDEDNLFVNGGSGGGVLTAWIVGKTDRFRAAVVAKPVINWLSFVLTADNNWFYSNYWFDKMPWDDPEGYWARSPLSLVGNVVTPTMLITGENDYRTPISETEQYYQALKFNRVETRMVRIPGAHHGIVARPSNLIGKVVNILAWFESYRTSGD